MNITLISPYPDITAFGMRTISSYLKRHGHKTRLIFMPDPFGDNIKFGVERYEDRILEELVSLCKGTDMIGITLMTNFFDCATQITKKLKSSIDIPIIWGGVHPTIRPEESLEYADMVCVGDGEDVMLELTEKMTKGIAYEDTRSIWLKTNGRIIKNPLRPLERNMDIYPMPDYSMEDHHIMLDGHITPLTTDLTRLFLQKGTVSAYLKKIGYQTMTGRGCPHKCTYCINDTLKNLYMGQGYLRWRSTSHVIEELLWVKKSMPYIGYIWISDDAFFARNIKNLEEFCREYKEKIGLPFSCLASPLTITEEKMNLLVNAGLIYLQMGIETGSSRTQELFNRKSMSNEKMLKAIKTINKYKDRMFPPSYDFILDIPYETDKDKIDTLRFISQIPKPYQLQPFSLVLSPGTKLYEMAKADGYIGDEKREIYAKTWAMRGYNYFNFLIILAKNGKFPAFMLKILSSSAIVVMLNSWLMKPVFKSLYKALKAIKHFKRGLAPKK